MLVQESFQSDVIPFFFLTMTIEKETLHGFKEGQKGAHTSREKV